LQAKARKVVKCYLITERKTQTCARTLRQVRLVIQSHLMRKLPQTCKTFLMRYITFIQDAAYNKCKQT